MDSTIIRLVCAAIAIAFVVVIVMRRRRNSSAR
jgi:hypothetical protein